MPLIVITGFPASGKSKRCQEISEFLRASSKRNVIVITENDIVNDKDSTYSSPQLEKDVRAALKGEVVRLISRDDIVILDALNYIKGYRYELFCISKNCKTPQLTLHCIVSSDQAWEWNQMQPESHRYGRAVFDGLVMRYEEPDSRHRWDSPLVTVRPEQSTPCEQVLHTLENAPTPRPNQSTQNPILAPTDFLFELDQQTQDVVKAIVSGQATAEEGDRLSVPASTERYTVVRRVTFAQLSRARRQFVAYMKTRPAESSSVPTLFVQYLNNTAS